MPWSELSTGSFFPIDANFAVATFYCFDGKLRLFGPLSLGAAAAEGRTLAFGNWQCRCTVTPSPPGAPGEIER